MLWHTSNKHISHLHTQKAAKVPVVTSPMSCPVKSSFNLSETLLLAQVKYQGKWPPLETKHMQDENTEIEQGSSYRTLFKASRFVD